MKKFIISVLCVAVFFIGLGGVIKQVGAKFKSDERAMALVRQARIAIGGEANINSVKGLTAKGRAIRVFSLNGTEKSQEGDFEVNLALPDQFGKMLKLRMESPGAAKNIVEEKDKIFIFRKGEDVVDFRSKSKNGSPDINPGDESEQVKKQFYVSKGAGETGGSDLLRTMLGLFASAPEGVDIDYFYIGSGDVDGNQCEIVEAKTANNSVAKIYLSKTSNLPVMLSYRGMQMPKVIKIHSDELKAGSPAEKDIRVFARELEASKTAEINIKFSDYRNVGGLQLPFIWTQTADGEPSETVTIENYEINPPNISEKFKQIPQRILIRTKQKP